MIEKIKKWVIKFVIKKYLGKLVELYDRLSGWKSQLLIVALVVVFFLEKFQIIQPDLANQIYTAIFGALPITLAQKVKRIVKYGDEAAEAIRDGLKKP